MEKLSKCKRKYRVFGKLTASGLLITAIFAITIAIAQL